MIDRTKRREELLRAARNVFVTKGYHDAKVDDIVAQAKVAKGTFYLYFRDKRSVFSELVDQMFTRLGGAILAVDVQADIESQVRHNIRAVIAVLMDDPSLTTILLSYASGLDPAFIEKLRSFYGGVRELLAESLRTGQALGIVAPGDVTLYATFTIGALKEVLLQAALEQQTRPREELVDALFTLLQAGYLRIPHASPEERPRPATSSGDLETPLVAERRRARSDRRTKK